jgi:hypothetical protein
MPAGGRKLHHARCAAQGEVARGFEKSKERGIHAVPHCGIEILSLERLKNLNPLIF